MSDFPSFALDGQVALVTGAARGLGRAISLTLAHAGADVALGLRDVDTGGDLAEEIEAMGQRALRLQMDVTDLDQVARAVDEAVAGLGRRRLPRLAGRLPDHGRDPHDRRRLDRPVNLRYARRW
jgi:NAD(P)-dependent dehydrogenase (short-subunit alcohol dehydrogenase family)